MKITHWILSGFCCLLFFQSCFTPKSVLRYAPVEEEVEWNHGLAIVSQAKDGIETRMAFEDYDKRYLIFAVEIVNRGNETVRVTPQTNYLTDSLGHKQALALDPEQMLLSMDIRDAKQEAAGKNLMVAGGVLLTAAVITSVTSDDDDKSSFDDNDTDIIIYDDNDNREIPLTNQPSFWADETIRKTDLKPGYRLHGVVLFPRVDHLPFVTLNIPIKNHTFSTQFKQKIIKP